MRRALTATLVTCGLALVVAACGGGGDSKATSTAAAGTAAGATAAATGPAQKITLWVGWSDRELDVFKKVVGEYDTAHPEVTIDLVGGIDDDKITAALRSGSGPDAVSSFTSSNVGAYCSSGGWIDLGPLMKQDGIEASIFPAPAQYYTQYNGVRCALPILADSYGFYYNKDLLTKAGATEPPKTVTELTALAKKLTTRKADGSLDVVGFDPFFGFFQNTPGVYATLFGAQWQDADGNSILATDPAWSKMLTWQKELVDFYGYDNLVKWQAGVGDEFSASNAFETGKLAMNLDGEWRVAFVANEHPDLQYGTAASPVDDAKADLYGSGYINGTIIGIPKASKHQDLAWQLVKFLTTDDKALAELSNGLRNVPSTASSAKSPDLIPDPSFATFIDIFNHPKSTTEPITAAGSGYVDLTQSFFAEWQAGKVSDLAGGLKKLDEQIDAQKKQAEAGQAP
jgi:multiple sugar transport system substrate-binding protein